MSKPQTPTPAEMQILLQAICIANGSVLACVTDNEDGVTFGPDWFAISADIWNDLYEVE